MAQPPLARGRAQELSSERERTNASGVILIVIGGYLGQGFAIQATPEVTLSLPTMLRDIANQIEADFGPKQ